MIFSQFVGYYLSFFLIVFFQYRALIMIKPMLSIFPMSLVLLMSYLRIYCLTKSKRCTPMFSSKTFTVSTLIFKCVIHFQLILYMGWERGSNFTFSHWLPSCLSIICWKDSFYLLKFSMSHCSKPFTVIVRVSFQIFNPLYWCIYLYLC